MKKIKDKKSTLITPDVIKECLSECFEFEENNSKSYKKNKRHLN
ncbi:hypothetical protein [Clostridium sp. cel8]|nr:hypothetical protein [Clostridium sp. cel8]